MTEEEIKLKMRMDSSTMEQDADRAQEKVKSFGAQAEQAFEHAGRAGRAFHQLIEKLNEVLPGTGILIQALANPIAGVFGAGALAVGLLHKAVENLNKQFEAAFERSKKLEEEMLSLEDASRKAAKAQDEVSAAQEQFEKEQQRAQTDPAVSAAAGKKAAIEKIDTQQRDIQRRQHEDEVKGIEDSFRKKKQALDDAHEIEKRHLDDIVRARETFIDTQVPPHLRPESHRQLAAGRVGAEREMEDRFKAGNRELDVQREAAVRASTDKDRQFHTQNEAQKNAALQGINQQAKADLEGRKSSAHLTRSQLEAVQREQAGQFERQDAASASRIKTREAELADLQKQMEKEQKGPGVLSEIFLHPGLKEAEALSLHPGDAGSSDRQAGIFQQQKRAQAQIKAEKDAIARRAMQRKDLSEAVKGAQAQESGLNTHLRAINENLNVLSAGAIPVVITDVSENLTR